VVRSLLLVDDNNADLDLLRLALDEVGWQVRTTTAPNGRQAIDRLEAMAAAGTLPDLVVLDLNMPGVTGWELLDLMAVERFSAVRRIVLTSSTSAADHARAIGSGAERCLVKPFDFTGLVELVDGIRRTIESGTHRALTCPS